MWVGLRPQEPFHWKSAGGRPDVSPAKKTDPLALARSLLEIARFFEIWSCSKGALAFNI